MKSPLLILVLFTSFSLSAQFHVGAFVGGATYLGELNDNPFRRTKPALGLSINYELTERLSLRSGFTFGKLEGGDQFSGTPSLKQNRNLSFQSSLTEFNLLGEFTIFNLHNISWSPYGFAGIAVYRYNPYVKDSGQKVFLQPLTTEGQGLPGSNQNPYKLTQFAIPFGGGIKFNLSDNVRLGGEIGLRRLFTDYLDDVSGLYADEADLLAARGPRAVRFAYRGDEVPGESPGYPDVGYPTKGAQRGGPKTKDWYYFTGLHLTVRIGGGYGKTSGSSGKRKYGCPSVPM